MPCILTERVIGVVRILDDVPVGSKGGYVWHVFRISCLLSPYHAPFSDAINFYHFSPTSHKKHARRPHFTGKNSL